MSLEDARGASYSLEDGAGRLQDALKGYSLVDGTECLQDALKGYSLVDGTECLQDALKGYSLEVKGDKAIRREV